MRGQRPAVARSVAVRTTHRRLPGIGQWASDFSGGSFFIASLGNRVRRESETARPPFSGARIGGGSMPRGRRDIYTREALALVAESSAKSSSI